MKADWRASPPFDGNKSFGRVNPTRCTFIFFHLPDGARLPCKLVLYQHTSQGIFFLIRNGRKSRDRTAAAAVLRARARICFAVRTWRCDFIFLGRFLHPPFHCFLPLFYLFFFCTHGLRTLDLRRFAQTLVFSRTLVGPWLFRILFLSHNLPRQILEVEVMQISNYK